MNAHEASAARRDRSQPSYGVAPPGYRLPAATRLGPVRLQVADVDRSLEYYEGVLGLRRLDRVADRTLLGAAGGDAALVELSGSAGATPVPRRGRLGLYHFAILLPDRAQLGRFIVHLSEAGESPGMSDHFVSEAVYLTDPDGLGIEVYADRPRAAWRQQADELYMTTRPLDTRVLIREAGGTPWQGMPLGTVLGHVHLFVDDLARAADFYHAGLGFDKVVWSYPGALFMSAGGYHHHLGTNTWAAGAPKAGDRDAKLLEWTVVLPGAAEVRAATESLRSAGFAVEEAADDRIAIDPWGTRVRLRTA